MMCNNRLPRRGMAALLVLMMLAMTLAVAYAVIRGQTTGVFIERNQRQRGDARAAALTGMQVALRTMHSAKWRGVDSSLNGNLGDGSSFQVRFTVGDEQLNSSHPDYWRWPYRVTVTSIGTATNPANPTVSTTHQVRAVVELVPRAASPWSLDWLNVLQHSVYQWADVPVAVELPVQFSGNVWTQGAVTFAPSYPKDDGDPFWGHIDEVAVFNKALTATDILELQTASSIPDGLASAIRSKGPLAYWQLNEPFGSAVAVDAQNFQHGAYLGAKSGRASLPAGSAGTAAFFDGVNDAIDCGNFNITSTQLTLLCWFKVHEFVTVSDMYLVGKGTDDTFRTQLWCLLLNTRDKSGNFIAEFRVQTTSGQKVISSGNLAKGLWYFAAGVYDGNRTRLYLNGVEVSSSSHSGTLIADDTARVLIGNSPPGSPRARFLRDLRAMFTAGQNDWRTVVGTWRAPAAKLTPETVALLQDDLGVSVEKIAVNTNAPVHISAPVTSYRLYPGGPTYAVPLVTAILENTALTADPVTNPLGLYRSSASVELRDNVSIQGTLLVGPGGSVNLVGKNVTWSPVPWLTIDGEPQPRRLPAVVTPANFWVHAGSQNGSIAGAVVVGEEFRFRETNDLGNSCRIDGRLVARVMNCCPRSNWPTWASTWSNYLREFLGQQQQQYFPYWLRASKSLRPEPQFVVSSSSTTPVDHWPNWNEPMFVIPSDEPGLRWRVIWWTE